MRRKKIINSLKEDAKYLCAGEYVFNDTVNYMIRNDHYTKNRTYKLFQNNYSINRLNRLAARILKKIFYRKGITIHEQDKHMNEFSGTVYLPVRSTNGYSDKKIFDLMSNRVLSIFTDEKDYRAVIDNYEYFRNYFPMPAILWTNDKNLLIMEELIFFEPKSAWVKEDLLYVMEDIFDRYFAYFNVRKNGIHSFIILSDLLDSLSESDEISFITSKINSELLYLKFPLLKLHGDLWTSNILLTKGSEKCHIHYIDWEWSNEFLFFYDLFMIMWNEVVINHNYHYIKKYAEGEYDYNFVRMFSLFNMTFQSQYRLDYLNIFFLNFFKEKMIYLDKKNKIYMIKKYKRLLEKIDFHKQNAVYYITS